MFNKLKIGNKIYLKGILPFEIYSLVDFNTKYTIVNIDYSMSYPITIVADNNYIHLVLDNVKLAS